MRPFLPEPPVIARPRRRLRHPHLIGRLRRAREPEPAAQPRPDDGSLAAACAVAGNVSSPVVDQATTPPAWLDRARSWLAERQARGDDDGEAAAVGTGGEPTEQACRAAVEAVAEQDGLVLTAGGAAERARLLADELSGFGPLAPLVRADGVTDVLVDGNGRVWTDGADGLRQTGTILLPERARQLAVRLLHRAGRRLDAAVPLADARVDGIRVHAVLPPLSGAGPLLSLRVPSRRRPSLAVLAEGWPDGERWQAAVQHLVAAHATVLVSGATGTGKTTLLSAALGEADPAERIITVEDTLEAAPAHPHVVCLQARSANAEGAGEVGLAELIRQALRMRPDRLVVGECRGAEVAEMLTALNTGHQGAWGTLHANSADDVPARLTAMGALAGWSAEALTAQVHAGVDAVLHLRRDARGRHPVSLAVPVAQEHGAGLRMLPVLTDVDGRAVRGPGWDVLAARLKGRAP
ncbi:TadA family conjugal transfer-associated ATPase [Micrococcus lylae]|uniref:TadA family conjugal transfer-associated ATPase n=1 Tax=Micrococcus lylae TaxID=1273 RepID=UPI000C80C9C3|nr:TadA family conjugal transfer-associated ATPase [Micrococcus lylae]WIK81317.1 TadA family conjugal transfer-associated ATPase [Micrococcus lylae]